MKRVTTRNPHKETGKSKSKSSEGLNTVAKSPTKKTTGFFDWRDVELKDQDWDFSKCPENELELCLNWEEQRNRNDARFWQEKRKAECSCDAYGRLMCRHFPKTPWLLLPEKDRKKAAVEAKPQWDGALGCTRFEYLETLKHFRREGHFYRIEHSATIVYPFAINWEYSDNHLIEAFRKWIYDNKPKARNIVKLTGKTPPEEYLRWIGARRLLIACGIVEAMNMGKRLLYKDEERSYYKAKEKAERRNRSMFW